jgi:hypothetical protein
MSNFEEQKAKREAASDARFEKTISRMNLAARQFVQNEITFKELCDAMNERDVTKLALYVFIVRDLKRRQLT